MAACSEFQWKIKMQRSCCNHLWLLTQPEVGSQHWWDECKVEQCISGHLARLRWTLAAMVGPKAMDSTVVREKWVVAGSVFIIRYQKDSQEMVNSLWPLCGLVQGLHIMNGEEVQQRHVSGAALTCRTFTSTRRYGSYL